MLPHAGRVAGRKKTAPRESAVQEWGVGRETSPRHAKGTRPMRTRTASASHESALIGSSSRRRLGQTRASADANRAAETTLRVDDLATLARGHALAEASGSDLLDAADLVRVVHANLFCRVDKSSRARHASQPLQARSGVGRSTHDQNRAKNHAQHCRGGRSSHTVQLPDASPPAAATVAAPGAPASGRGPGLWLREIPWKTPFRSR